MATMTSIVARALRRLRVTNPRETLDAIDGSEGLDALNDMMHAWKANGVDTHHTTLLAADTFPLEPEHIQGTAALLAVRLVDDHGGLSVSEAVTRDASQGWDALQAEFFVAPEPAVVDLGLRRTGRNYQ